MLLIVDFGPQPLVTTLIFMLACTYSETPRVNGAPWIRKSGTLSIRENLVVTSAYDQTLTVQTLAEEEGRQESVRGGGRRGDYYTAEVRNFAFQAPRLFRVSHMAVRT